MIAEVDELALVMREIAEVMTARGIMLTLHPCDGEHPMVIHFEDSAAPELPQDELLAIASVFAASTRDGFHAWACAPDGAGEIMMMPVTPIEGHSRLVISVFFDRLVDEARVNAEEVYLRRRPFAVGYFRLWQLDRIRRRRGEALEAALNLAELGVLLVARSGDIAFANASAERVLAAGDGLRRVKQALRATNMAEGVRLQVALNHVTARNAEGLPLDQSGAASVLALHRRSGPPLMISLLAPRLGAIEPSDVAAIMFIVDPALDTARMLEPVCRLYHLSPVETKLVCHLAQGKTLCHASEIMHVKEQTARSYMKQIFQKTDTNRQTELVVLMLSSLVRMSDGLIQRALDTPDMRHSGQTGGSAIGADGASADRPAARSDPAEFHPSRVSYT